jgi:hypothetical protein
MPSILYHNGTSADNISRAVQEIVEPREKESQFTRTSRVGRKKTDRAVLIPSVTLLVIWAAISTYMIFDGFYARQIGVLARDVSIPSVKAMANLQKERQLSITYLGKPQGGLRELRALTR